MILYVEANFILESIFDQEEGSFVDQIIAHAESKGCELRLPALALFEPYYRVHQQGWQRRQLREALKKERAHLARAQDSTLRNVEATLKHAIQGLDDADLTERGRHYAVLDRVLAVAKVLNITGATYKRARDYQDVFDLEYPDALVVASVLDDLECRPTDTVSAFVCRDKALTRSGIEDEFEKRRCTVLPDFRSAYKFVLGEFGAGRANAPT